jgi:hypothetical protein
VKRTSDGACHKKAAAPRLALTQPFFADLRFWGARLSDKPITVAFWRVAPSVRLSTFAILATGSLRAMDLRTRTSLLDHGLRIGAVFLRTIALATFAPTQMIFDTPITEDARGELNRLAPTWLPRRPRLEPLS